MPRLRRPSALLLGSALVLGALAPVTAYADEASGTTTQISIDDALAAVSAAKSATDAATKGGWTAQSTDTHQDNTVETTDVAYDAADGRGLITDDNDARWQQITTDHGSYQSVASYRLITSVKRFDRVLAMLGRPDATWVYEPAESPGPDPEGGVSNWGPAALPELLTDSSVATIVGQPTQTVAADGSTTYDLAVELLGDSTDSGTITLTVDADDVVTADSSDFATKSTSTYAYGPQDVPLPAASDVVQDHKVQFALRLLHMRDDAKGIADATRRATVRRHPHVSATTSSRRSARSYVKMLNRTYGAKVFAASDIAHGVRITATNPLTHERVVFTVRAVGKHVVVRRG